MINKKQIKKYKKFISRCLEQKPNMTTKELQMFLKVNFKDTDTVSRRSIRRWKQEIREKPVSTKPKDAFERIDDELEKDKIKHLQKTINKPNLTTKDEKPIRVKCPCGKYHPIPKQTNASIVCAEVGMKYDKRLKKWLPISSGFWGYSKLLFRR